MIGISLEVAIKKWLADPKNAKRIENAKAKKLKTGQIFGQGPGSVSVEQAKVYAEELRQYIYDNLPVSLKAGSEHPIGLNDILISQPTVLPDGSIMINLSFAPDAIHRESLEPERFPEGVDNIVSLFAKGYTAYGDVSGMWHGHWQWNLRQRKASPFMQQAVNEFLGKHRDVAQVKLPDDYKV